ncbi:50S ribosomal protein L5 [Anaerohalosphaera lusitana]|uniref:Large ribosomal subunit protein uL5 n=1 Tax=Anaerohalosphaera lusitana TaxID=1936003 RepID=A0A1U9NPJ4_9BACT|nr:50S ribosomal protein L5 [Anaerohalosphaera lusitana]AQT69841.1 50S ribosomal protein L5 [Anaerohalosphaera lusitana]
MSRYKDLYKSKVRPGLQEKYSYKSPMAVPRIEKVVLSMGIGMAVHEKKYLDNGIKDMTAIAGQKPMVCKARKSVSNFKLREGMPIGLKVTLRKARMYEFMDRLINLTIPRVKDFRGLNPKGFDGRGNFSMGFVEQSVFPEIDAANIDTPQGVNITFVTTADSDEESYDLLKLFGMPFRERK